MSESIEVGKLYIVPGCEEAPMELVGDITECDLSACADAGWSTFSADDMSHFNERDMTAEIDLEEWAARILMGFTYLRLELEDRVLYYRLWSYDNRDHERPQVNDLIWAKTVNPPLYLTRVGLTPEAERDAVARWVDFGPDDDVAVMWAKSYDPLVLMTSLFDDPFRYPYSYEEEK